jgi:hypothetical protein
MQKKLDRNTKGGLGRRAVRHKGIGSGNRPEPRPVSLAPAPTGPSKAALAILEQHDRIREEREGRAT